MPDYKDLNEYQKKEMISKQYEVNKQSFQDIASMYNTYANKVRRDAIKFKIKIRDKSEAQKNALDSGKTYHPTKGKTRSEKTKDKIGQSVLKSWEKLTDKQLDDRKIKARLNWENKTEDEKQQILKEANMAVRESSKKGTKLENFLLEQLLAIGYVVEFHKEQSILNTKLQIDLFLPAFSIAIEVDGPSHFEPVWGNDSLKRNKKYDNKKTGLILGKGWNLIRIKQTKDFSKSRALLVFNKLLESIQKVKDKDSRTINIED